MSMSVHLRTEAVSTHVQTELAATDASVTRALHCRRTAKVAVISDYYKPTSQLVRLLDLVSSTIDR